MLVFCHGVLVNEDPHGANNEFHSVPFRSVPVGFPPASGAPTKTEICKKAQPKKPGVATMPKRGRKRKKTRTHVVEAEATAAASSLTSSEEKKVPKSLVIKRGKTAPELGDLIQDVRKLMMPYTAVNFHEDPNNRKLTLQQYCTNLALPMGISHILQFSQNEERCNLRIARMPAGPVLYFRIKQFSLCRNIQNLQKRPVAWTSGLSSHPPVVVTNNFGDAAPHVKLLRITFQNMFPQINVSTVTLKDCRRVVLFNLVEETTNKEGETIQLVEVRHYAVKATPVGVNRKVRRIIQAKRLPNLHKCQDIAEYLTNQTYSDAPSDSEVEEDPAFTVSLPDQYVGKGNHSKQTSALKLKELGPRLSMQLFKVEKGLDGHTCLYHALYQKTPQEAAELQARKEKERQLKIQRKAVQEANVERKRKLQETKRQAKVQLRQEKEQQAASVLQSDQKIHGLSSDGDDSSSSESEQEE